MSYTLHYTGLGLRELLGVLPPKAEIRETTHLNHLIFTILWRDPKNTRDGNDLYGVEVRFRDTTQGPNNGGYMNKNTLRDRQYRQNVDLDIAEGHGVCLNGLPTLEDKLRAKNYDRCWRD